MILSPEDRRRLTAICIREAADHRRAQHKSRRRRNRSQIEAGHWQDLADRLGRVA